MQITAKLRHLKIAPRKVRLVADSIRGLDVLVAQNLLRFTNKKSAKPMLKLLNSAISNAENNPEHSGLSKDNLYISELRVDQGPVLKRWQPRAFGRASAIHKRTSHINIILNEKVKTEPKTQPAKHKEEKKDVKIVKSLDEIKKLEKKAPTQGQSPDSQSYVGKKPKKEEYKKEIKDVRSEGSDRSKQHLDTVRKKGKGGFLKRVFRRKSI